jgi:hypothetical protein
MSQDTGANTSSTGRQLSELESLPVEVRALIFKFLFGTSERHFCCGTRGCRNRELDAADSLEKTGILRASKQLRSEAHPLYIASMDIHHMPLDAMPYSHPVDPALRALWPRLHTLSFDTVYPTLDLSPFTSLRTVNILERTENRIDIKGVPEDHQFLDWCCNCLFTIWDEQLKAMSKEYILLRDGWLPPVLKDSNRGFKLNAFANCTVRVWGLLPWRINKDLPHSDVLRCQRSFRLTYNLETMQTLERFALRHRPHRDSGWEPHKTVDVKPEDFLCRKNQPFEPPRLWPVKDMCGCGA